MLYYAALMLVAVVLFIRRRPRRGMRLRLRGGGGGDSPEAMTSPLSGPSPELGGRQSSPPQGNTSPRPPAERPLNVVFNYNGHSWDAYEVLGLPAGSSMEKVEEAYQRNRDDVDPTSQAFVSAAYHAIVAQWGDLQKKSGS